MFMMRLQHLGDGSYISATKRIKVFFTVLKSVEINLLCVKKLMRSAVFEFYELVQLKAITNRLASNLVS